MQSSITKSLPYIAVATLALGAFVFFTPAMTAVGVVMSAGVLPVLALATTLLAAVASIFACAKIEDIIEIDNDTLVLGTAKLARNINSDQALSTTYVEKLQYNGYGQGLEVYC
jgi:hypothetical protein